MSDKIRILISGFGPFPGAPFNPTEPLVARLLRLRRPAFSDVELSGHIFPVTYKAVDRELPGLLTKHRPHALLMFGLASRTSHLRIETRARNAVTTLWPDADHARARKGSISGSADAMMFGPHTAKLLRAADGTGVDARASRDAGSYLCNYLSWRTIEATCRDSGPASPHSCMCRRSREAERRDARAQLTASRWKNWSTPARRCCWRW
jgi:pyroglutamyl-peptidase